MQDLINSIAHLHQTDNPDAGIKGLAEKLMVNYVLLVKNKTFYFTEIEIYYYSQNHQDVYCHRSEQQLTNLQWYFHGSGLDITCGNREQGNYGGILIRGIKDLDGNYINGPQKVVQTLFKELGQVVSQVLLIGLKSIETRTEKVYSGKRIGLNSKHSEIYHRKLYRFITNISDSKHGFKDKTAFVRELHKTNQAKGAELEEWFWKGVLD